jgi:type VI secretion system secreted protein Hcp
MIKCSFKFKQDVAGDYLKVEDEAVIGRGSEVWGGNFNVEVPTDKKTGDIVSTRLYDPLTVVKCVDSTSPVIFSAVTQGSIFAEAVITMYKYDSKTGKETEFYQIVLEDVTFTRQKELLDGMDDDDQETPPLEEICMTGKTVTKKYLNGNISHTDKYKTKLTSAAAAA